MPLAKIFDITQNINNINEFKNNWVNLSFENKNYVLGYILKNIKDFSYLKDLLNVIKQDKEFALDLNKINEYLLKIDNIDNFTTIFNMFKDEIEYNKNNFCTNTMFYFLEYAKVNINKPLFNEKLQFLLNNIDYTQKMLVFILNEMIKKGVNHDLLLSVINSIKNKEVIKDSLYIYKIELIKNYEWNLVDYLKKEYNIQLNVIDILNGLALKGDYVTFKRVFENDFLSNDNENYKLFHYTDRFFTYAIEGKNEDLLIYLIQQGISKNLVKINLEKLLMNKCFKTLDYIISESQFNINESSSLNYYFADYFEFVLSNLEYLDNYYDCFLYILEKNYQIRNEEDFMLAYHIFEKYPKQLQKAVKFNDTFILLKNKSIFERITNINKLISSNYNFYNFFSFIIKNTPKLLQCNHVTKFLIENNYYDVLLQNKTKKTNKNKEMNEEKEEYELL